MSLNQNPASNPATQNVVGLPAKEKRKRSGIHLDTIGPTDQPPSLPDLTPDAYAKQCNLADERCARIAMHLMHRHCAVIQIGSNVRIAYTVPTTTSDTIGPHRLERPTVRTTFLKRADFINLFEGTLVWVDHAGAPKPMSLAEAWLKSPTRRQFNRVVYDPGAPATTEVFNLWHGWGVKPKPGDWSILREHIIDNLCRGDQELAAWVLDWMADIYQTPHRKPGTAIAIKGEKGTGKTKLSEWLSYITGDSIVVDKAEHLTGNFNAHLANKILVTADEAMWGGARQSVGALNTLITSASLTVERKGVDAEEMRSLHRVIIIGNNDWLVPATRDERRYLVLEAGTDRQQDKAYFAALDRQMANGGAAAMLHDLCRREITHDVTTAPRTVGLGHQIAQGLKPIERLLVRLANEGMLRNTRGETVIEIKADAESTASKAAFGELVDSVYGRNYAPREVGGATKAAGIRSHRPHGDKRNLIFPPVAVFTENLERHLRTPLAVLAGSDECEADDE